MTLRNKQHDIDTFLHFLAQEKRFSPHTVNNYRRDLNQFAHFLQQATIQNWSSVKASQIRQYVVTLHHRGLSGRSIARVLSSLRSFYRYLISHNLAMHNPASAIQAPKTEHRLPGSLDVDQMMALLEQTSEDTFLACRDRAIMELFYSSGLRLAELTNLDIQDIDWADHLVRVVGKGNKQREVPVGSKAMEALQHWLDYREQTGLFEQPALFISQRGKRLGMRAIQKRLHFWGQQHHISDKVHPHRLRHAFASHMLESSGDLRSVQELLGHEDISTTQIYTHMDFQHLAKVYDKTHPRAKKK